MNEGLGSEITKKELEAVLTSFKREKSHKSDGWIVELFIGFYKMLEYEILRVVEETRSFGKIPRALNYIFIALIKK
jgi:hypothetical protein